MSGKTPQPLLGFFTKATDKSHLSIVSQTRTATGGLISTHVPLCNRDDPLRNGLFHGNQ